MKEIKGVGNIKVGDKVVYVGKNNYYENAVYDAEVIQITNHNIALRVTVRQNTIRDMCFGKPYSYNRSIAVRDLGTTQRLYANA